MKKYHKDYEFDTTASESNNKERKYHYTGDYYSFPIESIGKNKIFIKNLFFLIAYFLLFILSGLLNNVGSRNFFIALPYVFLFLPIAYLSMGTFSVLRMEEKMERVVYDKSLGRMYRSCIGIVGISLYLWIADAICFFMHFRRGTELIILDEAVFLFGFIAIFCTSIFHKKYLQNLKKKVMIGKV